jgi:hypothetical protein
MLVEVRGVLIEGVHDDRANGQLLGGEHDPPQRVSQQPAAEAAVLMTAVNSEPREERDRYRVAA